MKTIPSPADTIVVPAGSYLLSQGPLTVNQSVNIAGAGAQTTQIDQETTVRHRGVRHPTEGNGVATDVSPAWPSPLAGRTRATATSAATSSTRETDPERGRDRGRGTTSGSGGGISNDGGTLTLTHSLVYNNSSTSLTAAATRAGSRTTATNRRRRDPPHRQLDDRGQHLGLGGGIFSWCAGATTSAPRPVPPTPRRSLTRRSRSTTAARSLPPAAVCWSARARCRSRTRSSPTTP